MRRRIMAKSDSFFIRAKVENQAGTYIQTEIDLGSFVNLGVSKSTLLRIHRCQVQWADNTGVDNPIYTLVAGGAKVAYQLTTQSQSALVLADDKSMICCGSLQAFGDADGTARGVGLTEDADINLAEFTNGYLVGTDSIFLSTDAGGTMTSGGIDCAVVLECTLETATQASSTALALSQQ